MSDANPERYAQVKRIVERALEQAPAQRDAFVRAATDAADVAAEALAWLAAADVAAPSNFLDQSALAAPREVASGGHVRYRLLREIGRGGMSTVHLAERADGEFRQLVALKLINAAGGARPDLIKRFRVERQ